MKKPIILSEKDIRALPSGYQRADLKRLLSTRVCVKCELSEANPEYADLLQKLTSTGANLIQCNL